jgi:SnoaL-like domain
MPQISDYAEIRNVIGMYLQSGDDNEWQTWATLFTEDFTLDINGHVVQGREANRKAIEIHRRQVPHARHLSANFVLDIDGDSATASYDWIWVAGGGIPSSLHLSVLDMGRSVDTFRRVRGRWLVTARVDRPLLYHP